MYTYINNKVLQYEYITNNMAIIFIITYFKNKHDIIKSMFFYFHRIYNLYT